METIRGAVSVVGDDHQSSGYHAVKPIVRKRTDPYGLPLSTSETAAAAYNSAMRRLLRLQGGVESFLSDAVDADPYFAVGYATRAIIGYEWGSDVDVAVDLDAALDSASRKSLTDFERSFVTAVESRIRSAPEAGTAAFLSHIQSYPLDAVSLSIAVPTVAFGGLTAGRDTAELIESLAPSYGSDWWFASQLAFVRQDQERWLEAEELSSRALASEPACGHAVHARAHVFYETGEHDAGLIWLDDWIREYGGAANHRAHFSWHAALHELMLCDANAVRRRYLSQLAPPDVSGARSLIDAGGLLWRCKMTGAWAGEESAIATLADQVIDAASDGWLVDPPTAFVALHSAITLAAAGRADDLYGLSRHAETHRLAVFRDVVAPLCLALAAVTTGEFERAAPLLRSLAPRYPELGGSAAQREILEETLIFSLAAAGQCVAAARILDGRLSRRPSLLDTRRRSRVAASIDTSVRPDL